MYNGGQGNVINLTLNASNNKAFFWGIFALIWPQIGHGDPRSPRPHPQLLNQSLWHVPRPPSPYGPNSPNSC